MALAESFNQFAGKIVNDAEFTALLKQAGIDEKTNSLAAAFIQKTQEALKARRLSEADDMEALHNQIDLYLSPETAAAIEKEALQSQDRHSAITVLYSVRKTHADGVYLDILPMVKIAALVYDDKTVLNAFIKAAENCTDHRSKIGADWPKMEQFAAKAVKEIEKKFGL
jgi:hypothetical protein